MSTEKPPLDREAIRALVRQVLRDALPETVRERIAAQAADAAAPKKNHMPAAESETARIEEVAITTDAELAAFIRRVIEQREAIQAGRIRFRVKRVHRSGEAEDAARGASERIDRGIVNERRIVAAARSGKKLVLGRRVVVTPLARDKARQLGVQIERE